MKLVKQSFHIENQQDFSLQGIYKFIEKCTRVSYHSLDKITEDSYIPFVDNLIKNRHFRGLEFGTIHIKMYEKQFNIFRTILVINGVWNDWWIKYKSVGEVVFITTNFRYYYCNLLSFDNALKSHGIELNTLVDIKPNDYYPKRYTVFFDNIDRGIMDEFRTHVGLSHLAESTRYCNYSKNKFGNELTFIIPCWFDSSLIDDTGHWDANTFYRMPTQSVEEDAFLGTLLSAEKSYFNLLECGWKPQEARSIIPLSVKSTLVSCGFSDAWDNFIKQRSAKDAHPLAREIAVKLSKELKF